MQGLLEYPNLIFRGAQDVSRINIWGYAHPHIMIIMSVDMTLYLIRMPDQIMHRQYIVHCYYDSNVKSGAGGALATLALYSSNPMTPLNGTTNTDT